MRQRVELRAGEKHPAEIRAVWGGGGSSFRTPPLRGVIASTDRRAGQ